METTALPLSLRPEPALGVHDAVPRAAPQADDVARFNELMNGPAPDVGASPAVAAPAATPAVAKPMLGEQILGSLNSLSGELQLSWRNIGQSVSSTEPMTMQQMIDIQMQLSGVSLTYDLVSKGVSRSTQNLDQLVKMQ